MCETATKSTMNGDLGATRRIICHGIEGTTDLRASALGRRVGIVSYLPKAERAFHPEMANHTEGRRVGLKMASILGEACMIGSMIEHPSVATAATTATKGPATSTLRRTNQETPSRGGRKSLLEHKRQLSQH